MKNFIHRLPSAIISHIIPYTYQTQNKKLLKDIEHFKETKDVLLNLYQKYWRDLYLELDSKEYKHWLLNDILSYMNHEKATIYGYVCHFYTILKRHRQLQTIKSIHTYIKKLMFKKVNSQINILLGLLNIQERNDLVRECYSRLTES